MCPPVLFTILYCSAHQTLHACHQAPRASQRSLTIITRVLVCPRLRTLLRRRSRGAEYISGPYARGGKMKSHRMRPPGNALRMRRKDCRSRGIQYERLVLKVHEMTFLHYPDFTDAVHRIDFLTVSVAPHVIQRMKFIRAIIHSASKCAFCSAMPYGRLADSRLGTTNPENRVPFKIQEPACPHIFQLS
jgi:hypothetical protein